MTKILNYIIMIFAGWLVISPLFLGYQDSAGISVNIVIGLLVIVLAYISIKYKAAQWPSMVIAASGIFLIFWGAFIGRLMGASAGVNEVLAGILLLLLGLVILPFQIEVTMSVFFNRSGGELANCTRIRVKDGNILAKATLLGSMPETIYMRPEEICKAAAMMEPEVIMALPKILYRWILMPETIPLEPIPPS
jgi:hypothetical protein